jgi:nicotinamide-nucleotide amidase
MDLEVVTIGDELLLGHVNDTNATELSSTLVDVGLRVVRRTTVGDAAEEIAGAIGEALNRVDLVITTGGLGPTCDDITKKSVADLFEVQLDLDEVYLAVLERRAASMGRSTMPASNRSQAMVPSGAEVIPNPRGSAPGLWLSKDGKHVVLLPGVPDEMRGITREELLPRFQRRFGTGNSLVTRTRTLRSASFGESALADHLKGFDEEIAPLTIAFLPGPAGVDLRLTAWSMDSERADSLLAAAARQLAQRLGHRCYAEGEKDMAGVVVDLLREKGLTLAVAESCTGGMVGSRVTAVPGSSDVFLGGVIAYADAVKEGMLCVTQTALQNHGAVSAEVAEAMAKAVSERFDAGVGVAITGVAGPGGGSEEKPVGTVFISVSHCGEVQTVRRQYPGDRWWVRRRSAQEALNLVRLLLI